MGLRASCMSAASTRARRTSLQTRLSFFKDVLNRVFTARARGKSWCGALCRIVAGVAFGRVRWGAGAPSPAPEAGAAAADDKPRSRTSWWSRRGRTNDVHALLAERRAHTVLTPPSAPDGAQHADPAESMRLEASAGAPPPASPAIALSPAARSAAQPRCMAVFLADLADVVLLQMCPGSPVFLFSIDFSIDGSEIEGVLLNFCPTNFTVSCRSLLK